MPIHPILLTDSNSIDSFFTTKPIEHLQSNEAKWTANQRSTVASKADGDQAVFSFTEDPLGLNIASFAAGINQTPDVIDSNFHRLENHQAPFKASDFDYVDDESDPLTKVSIRSLPVGNLFYQGNLITQADIDASPDGFVIDIANIGDLNYVQAASMQDQYGLDQDSFEYRVHDGNNFSVDNATMSIDVSAEDRLWISTVDSGTGAGYVPDYTGTGTLQFGGPNFDLGDPSTGYWSSQFNLDKFGYEIDGLHYVTDAITLGTNSQVSLNAGDILFSVSDTAPTLPNGDVDIKAIQPPIPIGTGMTFGNEDIVLFRPSAGDYSTGQFTVVVDLTGGPENYNANDLNAFTLVETDTIIGDKSVSAGSFLFAKSGADSHSIFVMDVQEAGRNTTTATAEILIDGDDIAIEEDINAIDLVESQTTIGGETLPAGTILVSTESDNYDIGDNDLDVEDQDVFALNVTKTTLVSGTAEATASILVDGTSAGLVHADMSVDALSLIVTPDAATPPTTFDAVVGTTEDQSIEFTSTSFGFIPSSYGHPIESVIIDSLPTTGQLTFQGKEVIVGQTIDIDDIQQLKYTPAEHLATTSTFNFSVNDGFATSLSQEMTINMSEVSGDVVISGGEEFVSVESWSQVNSTSIGEQTNQQVAALNNGGYVVTWEDNSTADPKVVYQVFDSNGQKVGTTEIELNTATTSSNNHSPSVTALADGGFVIVWTGSPFGNEDVFAQRFDASGNKIGIDGSVIVGGGTFQVNQENAASQIDPSVSALRDGGFVVTWASNDSDIAKDGLDIVARVFESDGIKQDEHIVNTTELGTQRLPVVAATESGGYAIVWQDVEAKDLKVSMFDQFGIQIGTEQTVSATGSFDNRNPVIAAMGGEVVVAWQADVSGSSDWDIYAHRLDIATGQLIGTATAINSVTDGSQTAPSIVSLDDGNFLIGWSTPLNTSEARELVAAKFDNSLAQVGDTFEVNSRVYGNQSNLDVAVLADGDLIATYSSADGDNANGNWGQGIYADRLSPGSQGLENQAIPLNLSVELLDVDGSESIDNIFLTGVPAGAVVSDGAGLNATSTGANISISGANLADLTVTPPPNSFDDFVVSVIAYSKDGTHVSSTNQEIMIEVDFVNDSPVLSDVTASTTEDLTTTINESTLFNVSQDPDNTSISAPTHTPAFGFTLDPASPPPVNSGVLSWTGVTLGGSTVEWELDATHVSFDDNPTTAYPGIDSALHFDGNGGGHFVNYSGGSDNISFEFWFKPDNLTQNSALLEMGSANNGMGLYLHQDTIQFQVHSPTTVGGAATEPYVLTGSGISDSEFNHVIAVIDNDGTSSGDPNATSLVLYVNGVRTDMMMDINTLNPGFAWADGTNANLGTTDGDFAHATHATIDSFAGSIAQIQIYQDVIADEDEAVQHMLQVSHHMGITKIDEQSVDRGQTITLSGSGALVTMELDGSLTYDPNGQFENLNIGQTPGTDTFTYEVSDGQGGSDMAAVIVTISPQNDAPELTDGVIAPLSEDAPAGTLVHDYTAADADNSEANDELTYDIIGGNPDSTFVIDPVTGRVTLDHPAHLDFETNPTYTLDIQVSDPFGGVDQTSLTINLTDADEFAIRGSIYDDTGADGSIADDALAGGAVIHLYENLGLGTAAANYLDTYYSTNGNYQFTELLATKSYFVVVDAASVVSSTGYNPSSSAWTPWAEQTYFAGGNALLRDVMGNEVFQITDGAFFGGATAGVSDDQTSGIGDAQHVMAVSVATGDQENVDFGFSFNVVTNVNDDTALVPSQGSLRQFILNANAVAGDNHMRFVPRVGTNVSGATGDWWQQQVTESLPAVTDSGTVIDGQAYAVTGGQRDENITTFETLHGGPLTADGTVGTGADGVAGTGDEVVALTSNPTGAPTMVGLDAPELEIVNNGDNKFGIVVQATNDQPAISGIEITNISIHGFGDENDPHGANIFIDGRGQTDDGLTDYQVTDVSIYGNYVGFGPDAFINPNTTVALSSSNISVVDTDAGYIFDNVIAFATRSGINVSGTVGDGADDWTISGNYVHGNAWSEVVFDGIDAGREVDRVTITDNLITDNFGTGIDSWRSGDGHVYANNTIMGNGFGGVEHGGIRVFGDDFQVTNNIIHNNIGPGVHVVGSNGQETQEHPNATGALISQNSFSGNSGVGIDLSASVADGLFFDDLDTDGDGFLSVSELPASVAADITTHDTDGDGALSLVEYTDHTGRILDHGDGGSENDGIYQANDGNAGIDFLEMTRAGLSNDGTLHIKGLISNDINLDRIEIYLASGTANDLLGGSPHGEGSVYLGTIAASDFSVDQDGNFDGMLTEPSGGWPLAVKNTGLITTLAIDVDNNTSEFGNNLAVNDIPVAVSLPSFDIPEEELYTFQLSDFGFADTAGDTIKRVRIVSLPTNGSLMIDGNLFVGPAALTHQDIDNGRLSYVSGTDYNGLDSIGFRVHDGQHLSENVAQLTMNVTAVNDAPSGMDITKPVPEDGKYDFDPADFGFTDSIQNEGDQFSGIKITSVPSNGIITDGITTYVVGDIVSVGNIPNLDYLPGQNFVGTDDFSFQVIDDGGTADNGENTDQTPNVFTFDVTNTNDDPVITSSDISVPENQNSVMILTATDIDMDSATFTVVGGADGARFEVDPVTNELRFSGIAPDFFPYEDANGDNVFEVQVMANDGNGGSDTKTLFITITNVLEEAPVFGQAEDFDVLENLSTQFVIDNATDDDGGPITYSMANTGDYALFNFNPLTRAISFQSSPDFENPLDSNGDNTYELEIVATDDTGLTGVQTVTINVQPTNDNAPDFVGTMFNFNVAENDSTAAFNLTATDADLPGDAITYQLSGDDAAKFTIDNATGMLTFNSTPDYEAPADFDGDNVYNLKVTASDNNGLTTDQIVNVTVTPTNDNAPVFNDTQFEFHANENTTPQGLDVSATDADDPGDTVSYLLGGDDAALFSVDGAGLLTFNAPFDYESPLRTDGSNTYKLDVFANDGNGLVTQQAVTVTIHEINDNAPQFGTGTFAFTAQENTSPNFNVEATDLDDAASQLTYSLSGADAALFNVDSVGNVTFKSAPDYEAPGSATGDNSYSLNVDVTDNRGLSNSQPITIDVIPVNDHSPVFQNPAPVISINENTNPGFDFSATDADDPADTITYSLAGPDASQFTVDSNGLVSFVTNPDFESPTDTNQNNQYGIEVIAHDGNGGSTSEKVLINVAEVNDNDPVFTSGSQSFKIHENGKSLFAMPASDQDTPDTQLTYSLTGSDASLFQVDQNGNVSFISSPDFENPLDSGQNNIYEVTVNADDDRGRSSSEDMTIEVMPRNEHAPTFNANNFDYRVDENSPATFDLSASDIDAPTQTILYSLTGPDASAFAIDASGNLTLVGSMDFENPTDADVDGVLEVNVIANDGNGLSTTQAVTVTVDPVNDNTPTITSTTFTQNEEVFAIHQLTGTDGDLPSDNLTFSLSPNAPDNTLFTVNQTTGALSFVSAPDYENPLDADNDNVYQVEVVVDDNQGLTSTQIVQVIVEPINEFAPVITSPNVINANEADSQVVTVTATDGDRPDETLTYAISGGPDEKEFSIDPLTGELTFNTPPDYDNPTDAGGNNAYGVEVTVTDSDGNQDSQTIRINVDPTINQAPRITSGSFAQDENQIDTFGVTANDREGDDFSFALSGTNNDNGFFELDPTTGELQFVSPPDFESPQDIGSDNSYTVEVVVTDANGNSRVKSFEVVVGNTMEAANVEDDLFIGNETNEQFVSTISVFANDSIPTGATVEISTQANHGFVILNNDGTFIFVPAGDFDGSDQFEYTVTNGGEVSVGVVNIEQAAAQVTTEQQEPDIDDPDKEPGDEITTEEEQTDVAGNNQQVFGEEQTEKPETTPPARVDSGADTENNSINDLEIDQEYQDFGSRSLGSTYVYAGVVDAELISNLTNSYIAKAAVGISSFEDSFLAVGFWHELDSAKQNYLVNEVQIGIPTIAAASASLFTFTSIAIMARSLSGVLLTTFMTSQAWTSLDMLSVLEAADEAENESIEQMVDG